MSEARRKPDWPILVVFVATLVLVPLALYVGGYFWLGDAEYGIWVPDNTPVVHRTYNAKWLVWMFEPAGKVERLLFQRDVEIGHDGLHAYP